MARSFEITDAVRQQVPLLVGLVGPSGAGKTFSAFRLATGIQRVFGGDVFCVDTEGRRALHYADLFKFKHLPFSAPFSPADYLDALQACVKAGAKTVIVDSASHMHEGEGGLLEAHDNELKRLGGSDKMNFTAWIKPKKELTRFINWLLQQPVNFIFCVRSREKLKLTPGKDPKHLGFMPIASDVLIYEMTVNMLLLPGSRGVPSFHPEEMGEKAIVKLPKQFETILGKSEPLSEDTGEQLARWAAGGAPRADDQAEVKAARKLLSDAVLAKVGGETSLAKKLLADIAKVDSFSSLATLDAITAAGDALKVHPQYGDANKIGQGPSEGAAA